MDEGALGGAGRGGLLAVETATRTLSVALLRGGTLVAEITTCDERLHSERLLPALERLLALAGMELGEVSGYAVSIGPGSFTGLRIGLATVKGLALGAATPVAAVPTLAALSCAAQGAPGPVAALLDARRGEVYAGAWAAPGAFESPRLAESVYTPEALAARLPEGCTLVAGEGAAGAAEAVCAVRRDVVGCVPPVLAGARAAWVGRLGARLLAAGAGVDAAALVPRYLRRAEAEARRTGRPVEGAGAF